MAQTTHNRKKHVITEIEKGEAKSYPSVNKAKQASVCIQQSDGGLGAGSVRVEK